MHYASGQEVHPGDLVWTRLQKMQTKGLRYIGFVMGGTPDATTCNIDLAPVLAQGISPIGASEWREVGPFTYPITVNASDTNLVGTPFPE